MNGATGGGVGRRLRRFQERFEPAVTRIVLLTVFVTGLTAQFVQPVGDALEGKAFLGGALLSLVAYVLYDAVTSLSSSMRPPTRALVGSSELGGFVGDALQARRVEIGFLGYTGETLYTELYHRLRDLLDDPGPTRHVSVRILVPDFEQPMTVPARVGPGDRPVDDPAFRNRVLQRCRDYDGTLSDIAEQLTSAGRVVVQCEYRYYPGIPRDKVCIFNRTQVLHGLYDVSARMRLESSGPEYFDPKGYKTELNVWSREETPVAEVTVATWLKHFDDLWGLATVPQWRRSTAL
ncbi:hypothetical protein [Streptomyces sp. NWU339]|uniref:hypothetical protein n=1 Tax=Streptomyces sp. NWU339 TaxID=2185284 RepID=UPI00215A5D5F|nr:hypothetical protein [Streptomyces sp. NWU339]